jgi:uridine kinase
VSCFIIGISGGSGSGKTTFAKRVQSALGAEVCQVLSQDHYYIDQSAKFTGDGESVNFDHPNALDWPLLASHLKQLSEGDPIEVPVYDFATHRRLRETEPFAPSTCVVVDGTLILSQPEIRKYLKKSIFIDTPEKVRFERRLKRDVEERGRTAEGVQKQFLRQVKPMHDEFVEPSKNFADLVLKDDQSIATCLKSLSDDVLGFVCAE